MLNITKSLRAARWLAALVMFLSGVAGYAADAAAVTSTSAELSPITKRLNDMISNMQWGDGKLSALVAEADSATVLYERESTSKMQPGSLVQLLTAAAALDQLGPDYTFSTEIGYSGQVDSEKVLRGSIVIRSNGDPSISSRMMTEGQIMKLLDSWVEKVGELKVKEIGGSIIADARAFNNEPFAPGWPMEAIGSPALPTISAVNFNHNVLDIYWNSGKRAGKQASCRIFPDIGDYLRIANHVTYTKAAPKPRVYKRVEHGNLIAVGGEVQVKTEAHDRAAIEDPGRFFAEALKRRFEEDKIKVAGKALSTMTLTDDAMPTQTVTLDKRESPALAKILEHMIREDSALDAEVILKAMGMKADGLPGNFESGVRALAAYPETTLRMPNPPRELFDGSGRSVLDRLSAANVIDLMRRASGRPTGKIFESLLPRAGEGVLAGRLEANAAVHAITGSGEGVEAIAGWVDAGPNRVLFVFIVNGSREPVKVLRRQLDTLVLDLTHLGEAGHP